MPLLRFSPPCLFTFLSNQQQKSIENRIRELVHRIGDELAGSTFKRAKSECG